MRGIFSFFGGKFGSVIFHFLSDASVSFHIILVSNFSPKKSKIETFIFISGKPFFKIVWNIFSPDFSSVLLEQFSTYQ